MRNPCWCVTANASASCRGGSGWTKTERSPALYRCRCSGGGHIPLLRGPAGGSGRLLDLQGGGRGHRRTAAGACRQADVMVLPSPSGMPSPLPRILPPTPRKSRRSCSNARISVRMRLPSAAPRTGLPRAMPDALAAGLPELLDFGVFPARDGRPSQAGSAHASEACRCRACPKTAPETGSCNFTGTGRR